MDRTSGGFVQAIDGHTRLVGVIGWPIEHTVSPAMHNAAFDAAGLNWRYLPLAVRPEQVGEAVRGLRAMGFVGSNVTVPHKRAVMDHLDHITEQALAIGAVNTILVEDSGSMLGDNTDAVGFLRALAESGFRPEGKRAVVLGAGGAARAMVYALASLGASVTILNRTLSRAQSLVSELTYRLPKSATQNRGCLCALPLAPGPLREVVPSADLLVNATSVGMWPRTERSPWPEGLSMPSSLTVFDAVYNPLETKLLQQARAANATTVGGLGMLVHQGAVAWELWTKLEAPVAVMVAAARAAFRRGGESGQDG